MLYSYESIEISHFALILIYYICFALLRYRLCGTELSDRVLY